MYVMKQLAVYISVVCFVAATSAQTQPGSTNGQDGVSPADDGVTCNNTGSRLVSKERDLFQCLMGGYEPSVRPVEIAGATLTVYLGLMFVNVIDVYEREGQFVSNVYLHKSWMDSQLRWNPRDYGGVTEMRLPADRIWKPDIILYNNALDTYKYQYAELVTVQYNGNVSWMPQVKLHSTCFLDLRTFPFDSHVCTHIFGSSSYDKSKVNILINENGTGEFTNEGNEWDITMYDKLRHQRLHDGKLYPVIQYTVHLRRHSGFLRTLFIGPAVLLAALIIFLFLIPPQAGERIHLGVGVLIVTSLMLMMLEQYLPPQRSHMPILVHYLFFNFFMATLATILSIVVLNCYHRDGQQKAKVPRWMRKVFLGRLGRLLYVRPEPYAYLFEEGNSGVDQENNSQLNRNSGEVVVDDGPLPRSPTLALEKVLDEIRRYLKVCATKETTTTTVEMTPHRQIIMNEWHQVVLVIDRLMFCMYVMISVLVTIVMLGHSKS